ncbi:MAG TPA: BON domain-containing protein [Gemmatimonadaceae bacterium]|nr:BON domain-containing protein [Gemmatimonadaceae bacterium]
MARFVLHRDEPSFSSLLTTGAIGAAAGFLCGVLLAQRTGGLSGLMRRMRGSDDYEDEDVEGGPYDMDEGDEQAEPDETSSAVPLERRVLRAFRDDPILRERGIEIAAIADDVIELGGWVERRDEAAHAVAVARAVDGVHTVVNRLSAEREEAQADETAARVRAGDPSLTETRWEGMRVGTGARKQGTSAEPDRHADPRLELEERALDEQHALRDAADDVEQPAERRQGEKPTPGGRTDGSPIAPSGVPKGDHVAHPERAADAIEPHAPERAD